MKIALLTASCAGGGAERVQITLSREFLRLNHCVHFVAFVDDGPLRNEIPQNVHLVNFGASRVVRGIVPLVRFFKKEKPDVVIAAMTHVGTVALIAKIMARCPAKVLVRADSSRRYHGQGVFSPKLWVLDLLQKYLFPRAFAVIGVSEAIAREFREDLCLKNCHMISNPVATRFGGSGDAAQVRHPFFNRDKPVVIAIGRLNKQKGFPFLFRVFALLRDTHDANLLVLGEGKERQRLEVEIKELGLHDHVSLPGFVPDPFAYIQRSSVYALSSESEPFGLTLVEALSTGIPVVATETEGPRDILNNRKLGELVAFGDVEHFAAALGRALDSTEHNCDERIARAKDFAPDRIASQYLQLIGDESCVAIPK